jgi:hypothetical protein
LICVTIVSLFNPPASCSVERGRLRVRNPVDFHYPNHLLQLYHLPCTLTCCDTAGAGQPRLVRSTPSRPADVAVAQNDLTPSCAIGPGALALSRTLLRVRSMTSPSPSVTVMIRPAAYETTTRDGRPLAQAGTSYVADTRRIPICDHPDLQCPVGDRHAVARVRHVVWVLDSTGPTS